MATDRLSNDEIRQALQSAAWNKRRSLTEYRNAIELAHAQGWQHTEIARACGVTEAAIRNYLRRKKQRTR